MRNLVLIAALLAATATPTLAANRASGIPAYDRSTRTLWLDGRDAYILAPGKSASGLSTAAVVTVYWEQQGNNRVVTRYTVDERKGGNDDD